MNRKHKDLRGFHGKLVTVALHCVSFREVTRSQHRQDTSSIYFCISEWVLILICRVHVQCLLAMILRHSRLATF